MAENWNIKYESEKQNREKLANQLLESNKLTNQKSEEIENVIAEMERYRHLYNEISEKYNNERKVFENNIGSTSLEQNRYNFSFIGGGALDGVNRHAQIRVQHFGFALHTLHCNNSDWWSAAL